VASGLTSGPSRSMNSAGSRQTVGGQRAADSRQTADGRQLDLTCQISLDACVASGRTAGPSLGEGRGAKDSSGVKGGK
jgi:hypothetical protein